MNEQPTSNELRSLLDDVREYLDRFKDYRLIVGPPHKNDAWELMDRIDALTARATDETPAPHYLIELAGALISAGFAHDCESHDGDHCDACDAWAVWRAAVAGTNAEDARARIDALLLRADQSRLPDHSSAAQEREPP